MTRFLCISLVSLLLTGCGGGSGDPLGGSPGDGGSTLAAAPLRIWVTDAPFPYDSVESASVVIREVRVHDLEDDRWETVFTGSTEIDLVPLTNGAEMLLVEASIEPGTYDEVRLIVDAGEVVLDEEAVVQDGDRRFNTENGRLHFPSGSQTGIKVGIENGIVVATQLTADLVLDFDLARNFVFNGPPTHAPGVKRVLFTPSVRALNASTAGSIEVDVVSDNVTPGAPDDDFAREGATITVLDDTNAVVVTQTTGTDGRAIVSVPPGNYDVRVESAGHATTVVSDVAVFLANLSDVGTVVLEAAGQIGGVVMSDGASPDDPADDLVVEGATVELRAAGETGAPLATTSTDANGTWRFDDLAAGAYDVAVAKEGFAPGGLTDVAATMAGPGHTVLLAAWTQGLAGTVTVPEGDDPTGVEIRVFNSAGVEVAVTQPDEEGNYELTLATGEYRIVFDDGETSREVDAVLVGALPQPADRVIDVVIEP